MEGNKESIIQKLKNKFIPGVREQSDRVKKSEEWIKFGDKTLGAIKELRGLEKKLMPPEEMKKKTPAQYSKLWGEFNRNDRVQDLRTIVYAFKARNMKREFDRKRKEKEEAGN